MVRGVMIISDQEIVKLYRDKGWFICQIAKKKQVGRVRLQRVLDQYGLRKGAEVS